MKNAPYIIMFILSLAIATYTFRHNLRYAYAALRNRFVRWLQVKQAQLKIRGLRTAIENADADKAATDRKNMVVYNTASGQYENIQKRLLKTAAQLRKNKSNKAHTPGRRSGVGKGRTRIITPDRVRQVEQKSPYVTR